MPRNFLPIPNSHETITRPVALAVARQIINLLELPPNISILYPGSMDQAAQVGSALNSSTGDPSKFALDDRFAIEVAERFSDQDVLSTTVHYHNSEPYFNDPDIGVQLRPVYSQTDLDFTIQLRTKDRDTARRLRDHILARSAMLRKENLHECHYSYTVPPIHLHLLQQIHTMREAVAGYGEDFSTWVENHLTDRATNLVNLAGKGQTLVIQEHQTQFLGWFDFEAAPDSLEKDRDAGTWNWSLTYKTQFGKVIGSAARWPLMVHNQLIPEPWRDAPVANGHQIDPDRRPRRSGAITEALQNFTPHLYTDTSRHPIDGVRYPVFDEWRPDYVYPDTSTLIVGMIGVDPTAPRTVMNLEDFGDYKIHPELAEFMREEHRHLTHYGDSLISVSLYCDNVPLDGSALGVNPELVLTSNEPLSLRGRYHVRVALHNDFFTVSRAALERLRLRGPACLRVLAALRDKLLPDLPLPTLLAGKYVAMADLLEFGRRLNDVKGPSHTGIEYRMLTVAHCLVGMHRRTD